MTMSFFVAILHRNITIIDFFQAVAVSSQALSVSMPTWSPPTLPGFLLGGGGAPGQRRPSLYLSFITGDLRGLQQSAESWVEPQSAIQITQKI